MSRLSKTVAGLAVAGFAAAFIPGTADARDGDRDRYRDRDRGPGFSLQIGPGGVGVGVGDRRGRYYGWGPGFYYRDGYYHGNCEWLRDRARQTDSGTWWRRYRQCRRG